MDNLTDKVTKILETTDIFERFCSQLHEEVRNRLVQNHGPGEKPFHFETGEKIDINVPYIQLNFKYKENVNVFNKLTLQCLKDCLNNIDFFSEALYCRLQEVNLIEMILLSNPSVPYTELDNVNKEHLKQFCLYFQNWVSNSFIL